MPAKIKSLPDRSKDKTVISEEMFKDKNEYDYICPWCNCLVSKLRDFGNNNLMWYCRRCDIEFDPQTEDMRKELKVRLPDESNEPAVTSIQYNITDDVEIRHTPPIRGGMAELRKRGLKVTSYHTTEKV